MKNLLVLIFAFSLVNPVLSQNDKRVDKSWKRSKAIATKNDLKCRFVFCGRSVDNTAKSQIKKELNWIEYSKIETKFLSTGDNCDYCDGLNLLLENIDSKEVFVLNEGQDMLNCKLLDFPSYNSAEDLQNAIVSYVNGNKKKLNKLIVILIPPKSQDELNELKKDGWSEMKPLEVSTYDKVIAQNCKGDNVTLYRKKPCQELSSNVQLKWPVESDYSSEFDFKYVFAHRGKSNYYYFYLPIICSSNLIVNVKRSGTIVESFEVQTYIDAENGLMQFSIPITGDTGVEGIHFTDHCEELVLYSLELCDPKSGRCYDVGNYQFIKCPK